jgi:hypothetical protein
MLARSQISALVMDVTGMAVPDFTALLVQRAGVAADWIVRSIEACEQEGASGYYSRLHHPLRGWAPAFPEATGGAIPTLIEYSRFSNRQELTALAAMQARWTMTVQSLDGSFPGGFYYAGQKGEPSVFSTGQIIQGLLGASDQTSDQEFLQCAAGAARWLCDELNDAAGIWLPQPQAAFQPAHYTRVCWAMLEVWQRTREARIRDKAVRALETLAGWKLPNGAVKNWGLHAERPAFTETIADTLRGFWESGRILGEAGRPYVRIAKRMAAILREDAQSKGRLAGAYDPQLVADDSFICLPGHCQLAQIWLRMAENTGESEYFRQAMVALWLVVRKQRMRSTSANTRGAIAAASPPWARYWRFTYPNWSAKCFIDALMEAHRVIQRCNMASAEPADAPFLSA